MIELINKHMPRSNQQLNGPFESDGEIISFKGSKLVYNIDEFSQEDMLRDAVPYVLGWNMAVGSISDILASGGKSRYYAHSLVIKNSWTTEYVEELSRGIADVLRDTDTAFIGGDFGISDTWRYTGSVIGELEGQPLLRSGAKQGDSIFITGKIGKGNIEAALKLYSQKNFIKNITGRVKNYFSLRNKEALLIKEYSRCSIDTSDGVFNALNTIAELSKTGFAVNSLPYERRGILLAKALQVPRELLFLGECGEYELLFTVSRDLCEEFLMEAHEQELKFYRIGEITEPATKLLNEGNRSIDLSGYILRARDYSDTKDYLRDIIDFLKCKNS